MVKIGPDDFKEGLERHVGLTLKRIFGFAACAVELGLVFFGERKILAYIVARVHDRVGIRYMLKPERMAKLVNKRAFELSFILKGVDVDARTRSI